MENSGSIEWKRADAQSMDMSKRTPLGADELARIKDYARITLESLRKNIGPTGGYDAPTVRVLSRGIDKARTTMDAQARVKLANFYGAFLGQAIIQANPQAGGVWVNTDEGVGIEFRNAPGQMSKIAYPITRVFKHIDDGEVHSIASYFAAIPQFLATEPAREETSGAARPAAAGSSDEVPGQLVGNMENGAPISIVVPALCCNCATTEHLSAHESILSRKAMIGGALSGFRMDFLYCAACAHTAGRVPRSFAFKAGMGFIAYAVLIFVVLIPQQNSGNLSPNAGRVILLGFTILLALFFFWLRRPKGTQSSPYQPVKLTALHESARGIRQIGMKFSNVAVAREFSRLNGAMIKKGVVKVA